MGNICSAEEFTNKNYVNVNLKNKFLLILGTTHTSCDVVYYSFYKVGKEKLEDAREYVKARSCSKLSPFPGISDDDFEQFKAPYRDEILKTYRRMDTYRKNHEEYLNDIELHFLLADPSVLRSYGMKVSRIEDFIREFIENKKPQEPTEIIIDDLAPVSNGFEEFFCSAKPKKYHDSHQL